VFKKIEVSYTEKTDEEERLKRITEILAEGVYSYLRGSGLLKEDREQEERINRVVMEVKEVRNQRMEEIEKEIP
jgi:hypothetical protein